MNIKDLHKRQPKAGSTNMQVTRAEGHQEIMETLRRLKREGILIWKYEYDPKDHAVMYITTL